MAADDVKMPPIGPIIEQIMDLETARIRGHIELMLYIAQSPPPVGAPVDTGHLSTHQTIKLETMGDEIRGSVRTEGVGYAYWVHQGTSRMPGNPWLERAHSMAEVKIAEAT